MDQVFYIHRHPTLYRGAEQLQTHKPKLAVFVECIYDTVYSGCGLSGVKLYVGVRMRVVFFFNQPCHMPKEVLQFERRLISQALVTANGA